MFFFSLPFLLFFFNYFLLLLFFCALWFLFTIYTSRWSACSKKPPPILEIGYVFDVCRTEFEFLCKNHINALKKSLVCAQMKMRAKIDVCLCVCMRVFIILSDEICNSSRHFFLSLFVSITKCFSRCFAFFLKSMRVLFAHLLPVNELYPPFVYFPSQSHTIFLEKICRFSFCFDGSTQQQHIIQCNFDLLTK